MNLKEANDLYRSSYLNKYKEDFDRIDEIIRQAITDCKTVCSIEIERNLKLETAISIEYKYRGFKAYIDELSGKVWLVVEGWGQFDTPDSPE